MNMMTIQHKALLRAIEVLVDLESGGLADYNLGMCSQVKEFEGNKGYNLIDEYSRTWEHFSGCKTYPVPFTKDLCKDLSKSSIHSIEKEYEVDITSDEIEWNGCEGEITYYFFASGGNNKYKGKQLEMRISLLEHCIDCLRAEIVQDRPEGFVFG